MSNKLTVVLSDQSYALVTRYCSVLQMTPDVFLNGVLEQAAKPINEFLDIVESAKLGTQSLSDHESGK